MSKIESKLEYLNIFEEKIFVGWLAAVLFNIYFLIINFSWLGCAATAANIVVTFALLFLVAQEDSGLADYLPHALGSIALNTIFVLLLKQNIDFDALIEYENCNLSFFIVFTILWLAGIVIALIPGLRVGLIGRLVKYAAPVLMIAFGSGAKLEDLNLYEESFIGLFQIKRYFVWADNVKIYLILAVVLIAVLVRHISKRWTNIEKEDQSEVNSTFIWTETIIYVSLVLMNFMPDNFKVLIDSLTAVATMQWKWYSLLLLGLLIAALAVYSQIIDKAYGLVNYDFSLCLMLLVDTIFIPWVISIHTQLSFIAILAILVLNLILVMFCFSKKNSQAKGIAVYKGEIVFAVGLLAVMIIYAGIVKGFLIGAVLFAVFVALIAALSRKEAAVNSVMVWIFVAVAFALTVGERVYRLHRSETAFIYLGVILFLTVVALFAIDVKNKRDVKAYKYYKIAILIIAAALMFFPTNKFGADIKLDVNKKEAVIDEQNAEDAKKNIDKIDVKVEANGKNNKIARVFYYWDNNAEKPTEATLDENGIFSVKPQNGHLKIYCEDSYGVISTKNTVLEFDSLIEKPKVLEIRENKMAVNSSSETPEETTIG